VVLPVVSVSLRKPGVHEDVEVTVGGTLVHRGHVQVGDGDVVALLLQDHLPHVGGGDALLPRDQRELDLLVVLTALRDVHQRNIGGLHLRRLSTGGAFVSVTPTVPVGVARQAAPLTTGRQQEPAAQAQSRERRKPLAHHRARWARGGGVLRVSAGVSRSVKIAKRTTAIPNSKRRAPSLREIP